MITYPFLSRTTAEELLERDYEAQCSYDEMLAELGSSYFYGGAQGNGGYDALALARRDLEDRAHEFELSDHGRDEAERLEAANFMVSPRHLELHETEIPVFIPGMSRRDYLSNLSPAPSEDNLPF